MDLTRAKVTASVEMDGAYIDGVLIANSMQIGGNLHMRSLGKNQARFRAVNLVTANVAGNVE